MTALAVLALISCSAEGRWVDKTDNRVSCFPFSPLSSILLSLRFAHELQLLVLSTELITPTSVITPDEAKWRNRAMCIISYKLCFQLISTPSSFPLLPLFLTISSDLHPQESRFRFYLQYHVHKFVLGSHLCQEMCLKTV